MDSLSPVLKAHAWPLAAVNQATRKVHVAVLIVFGTVFLLTLLLTLLLTFIVTELGQDITLILLTFVAINLRQNKE